MVLTHPKVSILIPAYNASRWIGQTIQSAIEQTWKNKEVIIVDDGSTDETFSIAKRFRSANVLVDRSQTENMGVSATRNRAMALCQGDYIQWLDADDLLSPVKIERQMDLVREQPDPWKLLSGSWARFRCDPEHAEFVPSSLWESLSPLEWLIRKLSDNLHMQTATWLTSRELAEAVGPWDTRLCYDDDGEYFSRALVASSGTLFATSASVYWRDVPSARVSYIGTSSRKMDSLLLSMKLHMHYLLQMEDSPRTREACRAYIFNCMSLFDPARLDIHAELADLASALGVATSLPILRDKYAWLKAILGERAAWRTQLMLPHYKARLLYQWQCRWSPFKSHPIQTQSDTASAGGSNGRTSRPPLPEPLEDRRSIGPPQPHGEVQ